MLGQKILPKLDRIGKYQKTSLAVKWSDINKNEPRFICLSKCLKNNSLLSALNKKHFSTVLGCFLGSANTFKKTEEWFTKIVMNFSVEQQECPGWRMVTLYATTLHSCRRHQFDFSWPLDLCFTSYPSLAPVFCLPFHLSQSHKGNKCPKNNLFFFSFFLSDAQQFAHRLWGEQTS